MIHVVPDVPSRGRLWAQAVLYGAAVATLVMVMAGGIVLLRIAQSGEAARNSIAAQTSLLIECTTPPAERMPPLTAEEAGAADCYVRANAQTGQAVATIGEVTVAAAACGAAHPADVPATRRCVDAALKK